MGQPTRRAAPIEFVVRPQEPKPEKPEKKEEDQPANHQHGCKFGAVAIRGSSYRILHLRSHFRLAGNRRRPARAASSFENGVTGVMADRSVRWISTAAPGRRDRRENHCQPTNPPPRAKPF